ncbi:MAG: hypothetical protein K940chlam3_00643 [Chlamydiae bacterium]|nr:hypothetical protein [Chlamydiota bacterium]
MINILNQNTLFQKRLEINNNSLTPSIKAQKNHFPIPTGFGKRSEMPQIIVNKSFEKVTTEELDSLAYVLRLIENGEFFKSDKLEVEICENDILSLEKTLSSNPEIARVFPNKISHVLKNLPIKATIISQKSKISNTISKITIMIKDFPWEIILYTTATTINVAATTVIILAFSATLPLLAIGTGVIGGGTGVYLTYQTCHKIFEKNSPPPLPPRDPVNPTDHKPQEPLGPLLPPRDPMPIPVAALIPVATPIPVAAPIPVATPTAPAAPKASTTTAAPKAPTQTTSKAVSKPQGGKDISLREIQEKAAAKRKAREKIQAEQDRKEEEAAKAEIAERIKLLQDEIKEMNSNPEFHTADEIKAKEQQIEELLNPTTPKSTTQEPTRSQEDLADVAKKQVFERIKTIEQIEINKFSKALLDDKKLKKLPPDEMKAEQQKRILEAQISEIKTILTKTEKDSIIFKEYNSKLNKLDAEFKNIETKESGAEMREAAEAFRQGIAKRKEDLEKQTEDDKEFDNPDDDSWMDF